MDKEVNRTCIATPLGEITISEHAVIQIPNGLLGFEEYHEYVIYDDEKSRPFKWLIALDNPTIHFVVVDPLLFFHNYAPLPFAINTIVTCTSPTTNPRIPPNISIALSSLAAIL